MKYDTSECNIQIVLDEAQDSVDLTGSEFILETTQTIHIDKHHPHVEHIKKNLSLGAVSLVCDNDTYNVYAYTKERDGGLTIMFVE